MVRHKARMPSVDAESTGLGMTPSWSFQGTKS